MRVYIAPPPLFAHGFLKILYNLPLCNAILIKWPTLFKKGALCTLKYSIFAFVFTFYYYYFISRSALLCLKPGGSVVYSTCSLSPVQNDGVVYNALKSTWEDTKIEFVVRFGNFIGSTIGHSRSGSWTL